MLGSQQHQAFENELNSAGANGQRQARSPLTEVSVTTLALEALSVVACRATRPEDDAGALPAIKVEQFCQALISPQDDAAQRIVDKARAAGASPEIVYLDLLSQAARQLGAWWHDGQASFAEVSVGCGRIQSIMRTMNPLFENTVRKGGKSALFASAPGETHVIGVRMAADLFRRNGWEITLRIGLTKDELVSEVVQGEHPIVGLSAGGLHAFAQLEDLLAAIRARAPAARIMLCGQLIAEHEERAKALSADAWATDVVSSIADMDRLWHAATTAPAQNAAHPA